MNLDRIKTITFTFYFIFLVIIVRLFYLQVFSHGRLSKMVLKQTFKTVEIAPKRGEILDSQGNSITYNQTFYHASLYKPSIKYLSQTINQIIVDTPDMSDDDKNLLNKFSQNENQKWITLKYLYPQPLNNKDINFDPVDIRQYFNRQIYNTITGSINYGGLEGYYQKSLSGRFGYSYQNQDAIGNIIMSDKNWILEPVDGSNLQTSINPQIQFQSYQILKNNINKFKADSGSIIVLQPNTGNILSMVSLESSPSSSSNINPTISDLYEPGSIFKPLVVASALDSNSITTDWICTKCDRPRTIGEYTIENWDKNTHPDSSLRDIIKNSDNIGMSYVIFRLGLEQFQKYFAALGITRKTGIDLQGEIKPPLKKYWPDIDLATASFGQGFSLTQIQMITAFNVLANNGIYLPPHLAITNNKYQTTKVFKPETIQKMNQILEYSVNNSPVSQLNTTKLNVCAKSGTAQIATDGKYSDTQVFASYLGYFPCQNPKFTILVTLNRPTTSTWGSSTAAPMWFELAKSINLLL